MDRQLQDLTSIMLDMKKIVVELREDLRLVKGAVRVLVAAVSRSNSSSSKSQIPCPLGCPAHFKKVNYLLDHLHRAVGILQRSHRTIADCKLNVEDAAHHDLWTRGFKGADAPDTAENVNASISHVLLSKISDRKGTGAPL